MWPLLAGAGAAILIKKFFGNESKSDKKLFISFAVEDIEYKDYLVVQAKKVNSPFSFTDMSVKKPWKTEWKRKCRTKLRSCDGVIVLLSNKTYHSSGARWEIKCAKQENIPVVGMHIRKKRKSAIPPELKGEKIITWNWTNLEKVISNI